MAFLSSIIAAFIGAFAAVYSKKWFEKDERIIEIHVETHSALGEAYKLIFSGCIYSANGETEFDPPDTDTVHSGLKNYFSQKYILYTGYYPSLLQQKIDKLRSMFNDLYVPSSPREALDNYYEDYSRLNSLIMEILALCEDEVSYRRNRLNRLKRIWHKMKLRP